MWAMIPMLRVFSRVNLRGMWVFFSRQRLLRCALATGKKTGPNGAQVNTWRGPNGKGLCLSGLHVRKFRPAHPRVRRGAVAAMVHHHATAVHDSTQFRGLTPERA